MPDEVSHTDRKDDAPTTIAVLGSSGFIGTYLTLNLAQMGNSLRLLYHRNDPDFVSPRGRIETVQGSINDEESLVRCFEGCRQVYHLVGIIVETGEKTFQKTVADGTATVISAARKAGVKKIFYLSALGTADNAESTYFRTKWEAEQHIRNSGLGYTIFRPSIVYGIQDEFINKIATMIRWLPVVPVIGDGEYKLQPVYVEELCAVMSLSSRQSFTDGKTYEVGGPERLTYNQILDIIKRVLNKRRPVFHIPVSWARAAAAVMERMMKPAPLTRDQVKMMAAGSTCDHTVVEKEFGVTFSQLETQLHKYLGKL